MTMNQRQLGHYHARTIRDLADSVNVALLEHALHELDRVVGEAQNGPPLGMADGSLDPEEWTQLRDHASNARQLLRVIEVLSAKHWSRT